jgi:hypothetical protein
MGVEGGGGDRNVHMRKLFFFKETAVGRGPFFGINTPLTYKANIYSTWGDVVLNPIGFRECAVAPHNAQSNTDSILDHLR